MNTLSPKRSATLSDPVINCLWAICLLLPLFIAADHCSTPLVFHIIDLLTGWLAWTYTEYFFHRFVMHSGNQKKGLGKWLNHTHHHLDPDDIRVNALHRAIMFSVTAAMIVVSVLARNHTTLLCGYIIGFTVYSFMHLLLHYKWSNKLFPALHRFHIMHHCKHADKCFGIVFTGWDHLFGTVPEKNIEITARIREFYYKRNKTKNPASDISRVCKN